MGIRFYCPNGHKLNVKEFQAGMKGICPYCGVKIQIPAESTRNPSKKSNVKTGPGPPGSAFDAGPTAVVAPPSSPVFAVEDSPAAAPVPPTQPPPPAVPDPLAEAGEVVWYVRPASGGQFGPAGPDLMRTWLVEGRVSADSLVWREGWRDWREASEVFPQLGAGKNESPLGGLAGGATPTSTATVRSARPRLRRKSENSLAVVIILLLFAVLILSGVFVWVLTRQPNRGASRTTGSRWVEVVRSDEAGTLCPAAWGPPSTWACR